MIRLVTYLKLSLTAIFLIGFNQPVFSQSGQTQISPGLAGEKDARGRNPELFVTRVQKENGWALQVDAHVPHKGYQQYPIQFDFYINRNFFISQVRSTELPGPVGIDIGPDLAEPPFNYAVIAKVLHPTRSTHSMVTGAIYATELGTQLACQSDVSAALFGDSADVTTYSADVAFQQTGNNQFTFESEATAENGDKITYSGTLDLADGTALSGNVRISRGSEQRLSVVSGSAVLDANSLSSLDVASPDTYFDLSCE